MEASARRAVDHLPAGVPVDLVNQYAQPWCLEVAILATRADAGDRDRLSQLSAQAFAATGEPGDSPLPSQATAASPELPRILKKGGVPMPSWRLGARRKHFRVCLASGWLALLEHPAEWAPAARSPGPNARSYRGIVASYRRSPVRGVAGPDRSGPRWRANPGG